MPLPRAGVSYNIFPVIHKPLLRPPQKDLVKGVGCMEVNEMMVSLPCGKSSPNHEWVSQHANESRVLGNKWRRDGFHDAQIPVLLSRLSIVHEHSFKKDFEVILRDFIYVDHRLKFGYSLRQAGNYDMLSGTYGFN